MYLIFDTETTGLPKRFNAPISDTDNWPRVVQIAWQLHGAMGELLEQKDFLIYPDGFNIPFDAEQIHGISTALAEENGVDLKLVQEQFNEVLAKAKFVVGQNVGFDINVWGCEFHRTGINSALENIPVLDTCTEQTAQLCQIPGGKGGKFKLPTLTELYQKLFSESFVEAHNATADVEATTRCFLELIREGHFSASDLQCDASYFEHFKKVNTHTIPLIGLEHANLKKESKKLEQKTKSGPLKTKIEKHHVEALDEAQFSHLHNHSQFSVLQSTSNIASLVKAAVQQKMPAVALTDIGNMMGSFVFVKEILQHNANAENPIKPIVGCELNVCEDHLNKSQKDNGYQIVFLAKNKKGYQNLAKMASIAYIDGFYYVPRIDKTIVEKYKEDLIVLSGNQYGEIPNKILNIGENCYTIAIIRI